MMKSVRPLLVAVSMLCSVPVLAQHVNFDLPAGNAIKAIPEFARQAGVQIVAPADEIKGVTTPQVKGRLEIREALRKLLIGTGLEIASDDGAVITLKSAEKTAVVMPTELRLSQAESTEGAPRTDEARGSRVEEVVVTAQKREQRLQDVPISMSVMGGEKLDRGTFDGLREALNTVPGVVLTTNQNNTPNINIRGVSSAAGKLGGSATVAYYLDGIPFGAVRGGQVPDSGAYDLERVEILRGPQGTLYGASSLNGAVRVLTKDAQLDAFELKTRAALSTTEDGAENYGADMAINVPIVKDKLAARVTLGYQDWSGWTDNTTLNEKNVNTLRSSTVRVKVNARPIDDFSVGFSAWFSRIDNAGPPFANAHREHRAAFAQPNSDDYDAYSLKMGYEFPGLTLTSTAGYLDSRQKNQLDTGHFNLPGTFGFDTPSRVFSEEITLASKTEAPWRWTLGGMYRDVQDDTYRIQSGFSAPLIVGDATDSSRSYAVYGELTRLLFNDALELTAGLRYFRDKSGVDQRLPLARSGDTAFTDTSPRAIVTWHADNDLTIYASYAKGFRSGVPQLVEAASLIAAGIAPPNTEPDSLYNYEIGAKGNLFDGGLGFDAAVYYMDWRHIQTSQGIIVLIGGVPIGTAALLNGDSASGVGFDLNVTTQPLEGLTLGTSFSWNDLQFDSDVFSDAAKTLRVYRKGERILGSPKYTLGASADYEFPIGARGFRGDIVASVNHVPKVLYGQPPASGTFLGNARIPTDPLWIARAGFALRSPDHWSMTLFVDNAFDDNGIAYPAPGPNVSTWDYTNVRPRPRTIGIQLDYQY